MNIGVVCYASLGGSGIIATEIGLELARRGHRVHFFASEPPWRFSAAVGDVHFHQVPTLAAPGETYTLALAATIASVAGDLDVLHTHYAVPHAASASLALQALEGARPVVVHTLHGTDVTNAYGNVLRFCLEQANGITVPSQFLQRSAREVLKVERAIEVIGNFVDTKRFTPGTTPPRATLLHASNFRPIKRVADVVRVFAEVRKQRECTLLLAGDGDDRRAVEALARPFGDDITFLGPRHDMAPLLQSARVFILASESESFGLAALEAQSTGVPVVGTAVGGVGEVVRDGETGFLAEVGDIDAMAGAVLRLLNDDQLFAKQSASARRNAVEHFDRTQQVDAYERYFSSLLSSRAARL